MLVETHLAKLTRWGSLKAVTSSPTPSKLLVGSVAVTVMTGAGQGTGCDLSSWYRFTPACLNCNLDAIECFIRCNKPTACKGT